MRANTFLSKYLPGETYNNHVINEVSMVDEINEKVMVDAQHEDTYVETEITMTLDEAMAVLGYEKEV